MRTENQLRKAIKENKERIEEISNRISAFPEKSNQDDWEQLGITYAKLLTQQQTLLWVLNDTLPTEFLNILH